MSMSSWSRVWRPTKMSIAQPPAIHHGNCAGAKTRPAAAGVSAFQLPSEPWVGSASPSSVIPERRSRKQLSYRGQLLGTELPIDGGCVRRDLLGSRRADQD